MISLEHTTTVLDPELQAFYSRIAEMGGLVERQIVEAIRALTSQGLRP